MSTVITIPFDAEGTTLLARMKNMPTIVRRAIMRGLDRAGALVTGQITRTRFTGQGPFPVSEHRLGVKTNRLRGSLRWSKAQADVERISASIGTNVKYAGVHEYGYSGSVGVRAHRRKVPSRDVFAQRLTKTGKVSKRKGEKIASGVASVRAHRRTMQIPERAPLRTGLEENKQTFADTITAELRLAWETHS